MVDGHDDVPAGRGDGYEKASVTTNPAIESEGPDAAEAAHFLRRFAGLMANGHNAKYLLRSAELLEALTARASAASDEEQLWRYKYETLTQHADSLEAECGRLKDDIEGHVNVSGLILAERDALREALEKREAELLETSGALQRQIEQFAAASQANDNATTELRARFDQERRELMAAADVAAREMEQQRRVFERGQQQSAAEIKRQQEEIVELRLAFDRERFELQSQLASREVELGAFRAGAGAPRERIDTLDLVREGADRNEPRAYQASGLAGGSKLSVDKTSAIVPKETLRQARAQFEFLAKECLRRGDVATQAMCELGAHAMQLALAGDESIDASPIGRMALNILSFSDPKSSAMEEAGRSAG